MITPVHAGEGLRIFRRRLRVAARGIRRYKGDAAQICRQVVDACWNNRFFQASTGHFCQFYTRDFGICIDSLLKLGYRAEAAKTLEYALSVFAKQNRVTTAITPSGKAFDFPCYAPDSLAFLVRSLRVANAKGLAREHSDFLNNEASKFCGVVMDKGSGLVRKDRVFSSMQDYAKRSSSCYDNVMAAMLGRELGRLGLDNPLRSYGLKKRIADTFWNGEYFFNDLARREYVAGDANVFPFWSGVFNDKKMLKKAVSSIQRSSLDKPFPLKYSASRQEMIWLDFLVRGYEQDKIWTHMGPLYIQLVMQTDRQKAAEHIAAYAAIIERYKNFLEVFEPSGKPFRTMLYCADEGMLWAANCIGMLR